MPNFRERLFVGRHPKLQALLFAIIAACMATFFYGFLVYPDAPYKLCGPDQYCGKGGKPHTIQQYEEWKRWQGILIACWPFGMLASFGVSRLRKTTSAPA